MKFVLLVLLTQFLFVSVSQADQRAEFMISVNKQKALHGDAQSQYSMGMFTRGTESRKWYKKAAEQKHVDAMHSLARTFHKISNGISAKDLNMYEAEKWHRKAAERGHLKSMKDLGVLLFYGLKSDPYERYLFTERSHSEHVEAVRWFRKVIENKSVKNYIKSESMYYLARAYYSGLGVRLDKSKALYWYGLACDFGESSACSQYAEMKKNGY